MAGGFDLVAQRLCLRQSRLERVAVEAGTEALSQLWVFWLAPLVGGLVAGATYIMLFGKHADAVPLPEATEA